MARIKESPKQVHVKSYLEGIPKPLRLKVLMKVVQWSMGTIGGALESFYDKELLDGFYKEAQNG